MKHWIVAAFFSGMLIAAPLQARPAPRVPEMTGDCSEKAWEYEKITRRPHGQFFYEEDELALVRLRENESFFEFPNHAATPEEARIRAKKNQEAFSELLGWRVSLSDFLKGKADMRISAASDIRAKYLLIKELVSAKMKEIAPTIAREQFEMSLELLDDMYSEWEHGHEEKRYRPILQLEALGDENLACETAKYCYERQRMLTQLRSELRSLARNELLFWSKCDPETTVALYKKAPLKYVVDGNGGFSDFKAFLSEVPIPAKLSERLPELLEESAAFFPGTLSSGMGIRAETQKERAREI